ncbi:MAG: butyrate kinase [Eubacteriales bacterium]|nr:butyrate kinase [Eubacteriales bacterium]MDD4582837.1 butyrate kinase [Eubacteriales bacterium]
MEAYKTLIINLGSTSTKVACYENSTCIFTENLKHSIEELKKFPDLLDQYQYRFDAIMGLLSEKNIALSELSCVISRGGHTKPVVGGVYKINELMLEQSVSKKYGFHACDLGLQIAFNIEKQAGAISLTANPPVTDEFEPFARYSGLPEITRISAFQALNHKAVGKRFAKDVGKKYEDLNLIIIHMGGGISVVCHKKGKMVDGNNALFGDGPFSTNRSGGLPVGGLVGLCFSGRYTYEEVMKKLTEQGGLVAYVGDHDVQKIEARAASEPECGEVLEAMSYQVAKEVGAAAAVLKGRVDAIIITGGMANSKRITGFIKERVSFIAPVKMYPGEFEMESLAINAYNALIGAEEIKQFDKR